jgi:hypothetical protein
VSRGHVPHDLHEGHVRCSNVQADGDLNPTGGPLHSHS